MQIVIDIPEEKYNQIINRYQGSNVRPKDYEIAIIDGTPLTPDTLADLLMEERIRGELKQDISYSKDIIDDVRCRLTVDIIDHRPCYCGAELNEVWRESEKDKDD